MTKSSLAEQAVSELASDDRWVIAFQGRVGAQEPSGCRLWTGYVNPISGYGQFNFHRDGVRSTLYAHRAAWIIENGLIPESLTVDHLPACLGQLCCRPSCMELVSLSENGRRGCSVRWGVVGDGDTCAYGHIGQRRFDRSGRPYCLTCNRDRLRVARKKAA